MSDPTIQQLVERIQRLEEQRYKTVGEMNALRAVAMTALQSIVQRSSSPPARIVAELRTAWLPQSPQDPKIFPGIDPTEIAAFWQDYETSISHLLAELEARFGLPK